MIRTAVSFVCLFAAFALISRAVFRDVSPAPTRKIGPDSERHAETDVSANAPNPDPPALNPALNPAQRKDDESVASTRRTPRKTTATDEPTDTKSKVVEPVAASVDDERKKVEPVKGKPDLVAGSKSRSPGTTTFRLESQEPEPEPEPEPEQLSRSMITRRERIRDTLAYYYVRPEDAALRSPWGVMHAIIAYGVETPLLVGGEEVNAVGWLCWNRPCRGMRLFRAPDGVIKTPIGPGFQGHEGQFLAMMAQSKVKSDYEVKIDGHDFTIEDLVDFEKRTCRPKSELTFKLIGLVHYLESDEEWTSTTGQRWDIPRLIREELDQPIIGAACGGTHRMMGFSYAVHKRRQRDEPFTGQWERARKFVDSYIEYTFRLQNRDGSFSTDWFRGRGNRGDIDRKIQTTGHMLEWLLFSLPEEDLTDPRVVRAVEFVNSALWNNRDRKLEVGPKGHALRALALYDERVFRGKPGTRKAYLADRAANLKR